MFPWEKMVNFVALLLVGVLGTAPFLERVVPLSRWGRRSGSCGRTRGLLTEVRAVAFYDFYRTCLA
jgi:hypothetical protein